MSWGTILDTSRRSPVAGSFTIAVEYRAMMDFPFLDIWAPMAVSACPPVPENCREPMDSEAHWPVRSTSMEVLMEIWLSFWAMV